MTYNSKIEWTDHTFNPWIGCTKVSAGCSNCYAENMMAKRYKKVEWGPVGTRVKTGKANWRKPIAWNKQAEAAGVRHKVFCASLADVFEVKEDQPEMGKWRRELFHLIKATPSLDWLLLTKRPENVNEILKNHLPMTHSNRDEPIPSNIWIGTSVENQEQAQKRIPELLKVPAAVRFLSMEPLLGPVELGLIGIAPKEISPNWRPVSDLISWVIVGGESGPDKRPFESDWARSIRDQCIDADVPFFMKQMDKVEPIPDDLLIREFPEIER